MIAPVSYYRMAWQSVNLPVVFGAMIRIRCVGTWLASKQGIRDRWNWFGGKRSLPAGLFGGSMDFVTMLGGFEVALMLPSDLCSRLDGLWERASLTHLRVAEWVHPMIVKSTAHI